MRNVPKCRQDFKVEGRVFEEVGICKYLIATIRRKTANGDQIGKNNAAGN
jgi:hypothetical protein